MDIQQLKLIIDAFPMNIRHRTVSMNKNYMALVKDEYQGVPDKEAGFMFVNGLTSAPTCAVCPTIIKFNGYRYAECCSAECVQALRKSKGTVSLSQAKSKATMLERYGVENYSQLPEMQERRKATLMERYGSFVTENHPCKNPQTAETLNIKGRETILSRYGVHNASQIPGHKDKRKQTCLEKYGNSNPQCTQEKTNQRAAQKLNELNNGTPESIQVVEIVAPDSQKGQVLNRYITSCSCGLTEPISSETFKYRIKISGTPCQKCSGLQTSKSLKECALFSELSGVFPAAIQSNRTLISPYELDIVLPDQKIAIEFCGLFWHSGESKDSNYHLLKHNMCRDIGYKLITVFEDEWDQRPQLVIKRIKHMAGYGQPVVGARSCTLGEVTTQEARKFIDEHHLQGYANSSIKLGLYLNTELVSIMTFSKPSKAKGQKVQLADVWEISRFCSSKNVAGAASKLFKYFVNLYKPHQIYSYADLRWGSGDVYGKLGFSFSHNSRPNYWYVEKGKRIHRFLLRKNASDEQTLTEWENRKKQGYRRIYDCGHAKWIWNKP